MHVDYRPTWVISLTSDELLLVGKALCGKLSAGEDKAALELNVKLCHSRFNRCQEVVENAGKALEGAWKQLPPDHQSALKLQYEKGTK